MPSENSAPKPTATATAAGMTARTSGMRNASRKRRSSWASPSVSAPPAARRAFLGTAASAARSAAPRQRTTRRRARTPRGTDGRADRDRAARSTSANSAAPSGIVPYDVPSTSPFASGRSSLSTRSGIDESRAGRNTRLRDLDRERPDVDPPEPVHERYHDDDPGAHDVHRDHDPAPIPARRGARRERSADRAREQPQRQDAADRGRRPRLLQHQRHERDGAHPVAERGHGLTDEHRAVAGPSPEHRDAHARPSDSTAGPARSSVPS